MRRAFSVVELLTALTVLGVVLALIGRAAVSHERLQRKLSTSDADARAAQQTVAILSAVLAPVAPGDLAAGQLSDSAVELSALVGAGVACVMSPGLVIGAGAHDGAALASLFGDPEPGDVALVLDESVLPPTWRSLHIDAVTSGPAPCAAVSGDTGLLLHLAEPPGIAPLAVVRFVRRIRFSLYRSGDRRWYLGMRDWNAAADRFNAVQPVAGPLAAYSADAARTGLRFTYVDSTGREGPPQTIPAQDVRMIRIVARPEDGADSARRTVGLRNAP